MNEPSREEVLEDLERACRHHPDLRQFLENPNLSAPFEMATPYSQPDSRKTKTRKGERTPE
jgi:hypothetical protein